MSILKYSEKLFKKKSLPNNLHYCNICPYFTTSAFFLANHIGTHGSSCKHFDCENSTIENYHCKDCSFRTDLFLIFKEHRKRVHGIETENQENVNVEYNTQSYTCKNCSFETHFLMKWMQHRMACKENALTSSEIFNGNTPIYFYRSDQSPHVVQLSETVETHKTKFNVEEVSKYEVEDCVECYKCEFCDYKSIYKTSLNIHYNLNHGTPTWYRCRKCPYRAKFKIFLQNHIDDYHMDDKVIDLWNLEHSYSKHPSEQEVRWYHCGSCLYKTKIRNALKDHINLVHPWCKCDNCSFKTRNRNILQEHRHSNHLRGQTNWYQCDKRPYRSKYKWTISGHKVQYHSNNNGVFVKNIIRPNSAKPSIRSTKLEFKTILVPM